MSVIWLNFFSVFIKNQKGKKEIENKNTHTKKDKHTGVIGNLKQR